MTNIRWVAVGGGRLLDAGNWDGGVVPGPADGAVIDLPGPFVVSADGAFAFQSLTVSSNGVTVSIEAPGSSSTLGDITSNGSLQLDRDYGSGGSSLTVTGTLTNSGLLSLGTGYDNIGAATALTTAFLVNTGEIDVYGANGPSAPAATLEDTGDQAPATLTATWRLSGHSQFDFGAGGGVTSIAAAGLLSIAGPDAKVTVADDDSHSGALDGLTSNAGQLYLSGDAVLATTADEDFNNSGTTSIETGGSLGVRRNVTNTGSLQLDRDYATGGSSLDVTGTLTNSGLLSLGTGYDNIGAATALTTAFLVNTGEIDVYGAGGASAPAATLEDTGDEAPATLTATWRLSGHAQFDFGAGGGVTAIAAAGLLSIAGPDAKVTVAGDDSHSGALDGLTSNAGQLYLSGDAVLATTADEDFNNSGTTSIETGGSLGVRRNVTNTGSLQLDRDYATGGSSLIVTGTLTNSGLLSLGTGYDNIGAATALTTAFLANTGEIDVYGAGGPAAPAATLEDTGDAAPATLTATWRLSGHAQFDFGAGGGVTAIAAAGLLSIAGADAKVTVSSDDSHSGALDGLTSNAGQLYLSGSAVLATTADEDFNNSGTTSIETGGSLGVRRNVTNTGSLQLDRDYATGGSSLIVMGTLTNSGLLSLGTGYDNIGAATTLTTAFLANTGEIDVYGAGGASAPAATIEDTGDEAPATLTATWRLSGHAQFDFGAGGGVTAIAAAGLLSIAGPDAKVTVAGDDSHSGALDGLTSNAGQLYLSGDAVLATTADEDFNNSGTTSIETGGSLGVRRNVTNTGSLQLDRDYATGGSSLTVTGTLTNSGLLSLGTGYDNIGAATTLTTAFLANTGEIDVYGAGGPAAPAATLDDTGDEAPATLTGTWRLSGHAQSDFGAGGEIEGIAAAGLLSIAGPDAKVTVSGDDSHSSALDGLASNAGQLYLSGGAALTATAGQGLINSGTLQLDRDYASGGSSLTVAGTLTNSGLLSLGTGYDNLQAATTLAAGALSNTGTVQLYGSAGISVSLTAGSADNAGSVGLYAGAALDSSGGYMQTAGTTRDDGILTAAALTLAGGSLDGTGTVQGAIDNQAGTIRGGDGPDAPGLLTVTGSFTEADAATLEEDIAGLTQASGLAVAGAVTLDGGVLSIATANGFGFALGQAFTVLSFTPGSLSGRFRQLSYGSYVGNGDYVATGTGLYLQADYDDAGGALQLDVVSTPPVEPASPVISPTTVAIGNVHVGDPGTVAIAVTNAAVQPADSLDVAVASATPGVAAAGAIAALAPGQTDDASLRAGIDTSAAGARSGLVTLTLTSDGGGGILAPLPGQTLTVTGAAYRFAAPALTGVTAVVHAGDPGLFAIGVSNTDPADGYSESLDATASGVSGGVTAVAAAPAVVTAGAASPLAVQVATAVAGVVSGTVTLALASDGTGIDGLGATALAPQTAGVAVTVDNYAVPGFELLSDGGLGSAIVADGANQVLNLGTVARGSGPVTLALAVLNAATGPADLLSGTIAASGSSAFAASGLDAFAGLGAGQADAAPTVTLDTSEDGTFTETLTLDGMGSNSSGYSAALASRTLTVTGTVADLPAPVIAGASDQSAFAGVSAVLGPLSVSDGDAASPVTVTVTDGSGTLSAAAAGSVQVAVGPGGHSIVLRGRLADINASLASLAYMAAAPGADTVTVQVSEAGAAASSSLVVTTAPPPAAADQAAVMPVLQVPDKLTLAAGQPTGVPGIAVVLPPGADPSVIYTLTLDSQGSQLTVTGGAGGSVTGQGTGHLTITGTAAQIDAYFDDGLLDYAIGGIYAVLIALAVATGNPDNVKEINNLYSAYDDARKKSAALSKALETAEQLNAAEEIAEDVHVLASNGSLFQLEQVGEFTLARSTAGGNLFDVQVRTAPANGSLLGSVVVALAAGFGTDDVMLTVDGPLLLNGTATALAIGGTLGLAAGRVTHPSDGLYQLFWNTGETVTVAQAPDLLNLTVGFGVGDTAASIAGLVGPGRTAGTQFGATQPSGTLTAQQFAAYVDTLRVTDATSLFTYAPGQSTATFTDESAPTGSLDLSTVPAGVLAMAQAAVAAAGISDPGLVAAAELDFLLSGGDSGVVQTDAAIFAGRSTQAAPVAPPPAALAFGVVADAATLTTASSGDTDATFTVYLTGTAATDTIFDYAAVADAAGELDAAAFGGTLPSGSVTIPAGQSSAQFTVAIPQGALGTDVSDTLAVAVTPSAPLAAVDTAASTTVIQPTAGSPPSVSVSLLSGAGTLVQTGDTYSLDLGAVTYEGGTSQIELRIANTAPLGSDSLGGTFAVDPVTGFTVTGASLPAPIAPGQSYDGLILTLNQNKFGANSETITYTPADTNDTGFDQPLDPVTIDVDYTLEAPTMAYSQAWGDVHIITYNNLKYDFQAVGEFVLAHSTYPGDDFDIQLRLSPLPGSSSISIITEVGLEIGGDRVTFGIGRDSTVWLNGVPSTVSPADPVLQLPGGSVTELSSTTWKVAWGTGETATITQSGNLFNVVDGIPTAETGYISGLQGENEGQANDFQLPDGTVLAQPLSAATLYGEYADGWRVSDATSLFDYAPGQDTASFTDRNFPSAPLNIASLPAAVQAQAAAAVAAAGITDPAIAQAAMLDYLATGDPRLIDASALVQDQAGSTTAADVSAPATPPQAISVTADAISLVEAADGPTQVTFTVTLADPAAAPLSVGYAVVAPDPTFVGAAGFGGTLPAGTVQFAAGQNAVTVTVDVPQAALAGVPAANLAVRVAAMDATPVAIPQAQTMLVSAVPVAGPPALPALVDLSTLPGVIFTQSGTTYTLDLGTLLQGQAAPVVNVGLSNGAAAGADFLSGSFGAPLGDGFVVTGNALPEALAAGGMYAGLFAAAATGTPGSYTETVTFAGRDLNPSGYAANLAPLTLVLTDMVAAPAGLALNTPATLVFGNARLGDAESQAVSVSNTASAGGAALDVTPVAQGAVVATGSLTGLAAGATDAAAIRAGLSTGSAGSLSGTVSLQGTSEAGGGVALAGSPVVDVFGSVYRPAAAGTIAPVSGVVHVGDPGVFGLAVSNTDPADGYSEDLLASVSAVPAGVTASAGSTPEIAPGGSDASLMLTADTSAAAVLSGTAAVALTSDGGAGAGSIDGLGQLALGTQEVPVSVTVDNYATPALSATVDGTAATISAGVLNLGTLLLGSGPVLIALSEANAAAGPADLLAATFGSSAGAGFTDALSPVSGLGAGQSGAVGTVTLSTDAPGTFSETITASPVGSNASGYSGALGAQTLTITGTVAGGAGATPPAAPTIALVSPADGSTAAKAIVDTPTPAVAGATSAGAAVSVLTGSAAVGSTGADPATGAYTDTLATGLPLGLSTLSASATNGVGTTPGTGTASAFVLPSPVDGVSTAALASIDIGRLFDAGFVMQFTPGTEAVDLLDGVLSVGADTDEAYVQRLYEGLLGRGDDLSGMSHWIGVLAAGGSKADVAAGFLSAPEFLQDYGTASAIAGPQFIAMLYQGLLGRAPTAGDLSFWGDRLAQYGQAAVLGGIADSPEAKAHAAAATAQVWAPTVLGTLNQELYGTGLGREAEPAGNAYWQGVLPGLSTSQAAALFAATPEFQSLHAAQDPATYVQSLFDAGLGRDPTGAEAQPLVAGLQGGTLSEADVLVDVATSPGAAAYLTRNLNATSPGAALFQPTDAFAGASATPGGYVFRG